MKGKGLEEECGEYWKVHSKVRKQGPYFMYVPVHCTSCNHHRKSKGGIGM